VVQQPLPGAMRGRHAGIQLLVSLDATYNGAAVKEAAQCGIPTAGLVNHHRDLSYLTFPIFARDYHPRFQHFFLDWLLRVANVRLSDAAHGSGAGGPRAAAAAATAAAPAAGDK